MQRADRTPVVMQLQVGQTRLYAHHVTEAFSLEAAISIAREFRSTFVQDADAPAWRNVPNRKAGRRAAR
jgi:hypothetical protein